MVLYARADVDYVCVPKESGGCGEPHRRPVSHGAPASVFMLNCQGCENYLRADIARSGNKRVRTVNSDHGMKLDERYLGLWGASPDTIPESPDEEKKREHDTQKMVTENAASQTQTLAQIGAAVAGNAELMAKFIELQMSLAAKGQSPAIPEPVATVEHPPFDQPTVVTGISGDGSLTTTTDFRECLGCGVVIVRREGQRGALPQRCVACKAKKTTARRKVA